MRLYFSSLIKTNPKYSLSAENLFSVLSDSGEKYTLFDGAKDIWARDYMPVKTKSGKPRKENPLKNKQRNKGNGRGFGGEGR